MWDLKIPKVLYLYWGRNKKLSYLRYLTVRTFMKLNPDWKVVVYYPKFICIEEDWDTGEHDSYNPKGADYFHQLINEQNERLIIKEFNFKAETGILETTPEVIKSDILRLYLLHKEGGVWSDFDIFYIKTMGDLVVDDINKDAYVCDNGKYFSIGFLMGALNNTLYKLLYDKAVDVLHDGGSTDYQRVGSKLFKQYVGNSSKIGNIIPNALYPVAYNDVYGLFCMASKIISLSLSIGVHWFGGNEFSHYMDNDLTPNNIQKFPPSKMKRLIQEMGLVTT